MLRLSRVLAGGVLPLLLFSGTANGAGEAFWNTPATLTDENTSVNFEVDSTWHMVEGKTSGVRGAVWLETPADFRSIRAEISFPVARFDTDNGTRDEKLRSVMAVEKFSLVEFRVNSVERLCDPARLAPGSPCAVTLAGHLTIRGLSKPHRTEAEIRTDGKAYVIAGTTSLRWDEFGVEDPSMLVARLDPVVNVKFSCTLK